MDTNGRIWTESQTAAYFGRSVSWLRRRKGKLEAKGFPKFDHDLGGRDSVAVKRFIDDRFHLERSASSQSELLRKRAEAIANGGR